MTNRALPQLREMKLKEAAKKVRDGVEETLTYCRFPYEHRTLTRTNNMIERPNPESAAVPGGGYFPRWQSCPHTALRQAPPCGRNSVGLNIRNWKTASEDTFIAG